MILFSQKCMRPELIRPCRACCLKIWGPKHLIILPRPSNDILPHTQDCQLAGWEDESWGTCCGSPVWGTNYRRENPGVIVWDIFLILLQPYINPATPYQHCQWNFKAMIDTVYCDYWFILIFQVLDRFRDGLEKILITTNVLSRGIDVEQVTDYYRNLD